jgi:hypothetical protein
MSLLNNDEASALVDKVHRDRPHSDAYDLAHLKIHAPHGNDGTPMGPMSTDNVDCAINKASVAPVCNKTTPCGNKKHPPSQRHLQHHGNGRPRSKSLDVHRHSADPIQKKKYAHHHVHQSPSRDHRHHGRNSPTYTIMADETTPRRLQGKLWIRPAATSSPLTFSLPTPGNVAWAERSPVPHQYQAMIEDGMGFAIVSSPTALNGAPSPTACRSTNRPLVLRGDSFDDDMLPTSSAMFPSSSSSFDPYRRMHHTTRTIFGESGKPIKPRAAYLEQHAFHSSNLST